MALDCAACARASGRNDAPGVFLVIFDITRFSSFFEQDGWVNVKQRHAGKPHQVRPPGC